MTSLYQVGQKVRLRQDLGPNTPDPEHVGFVGSMFEAARKGVVFEIELAHRGRRSYTFKDNPYGAYNYAENWLVPCDPNWHPPTKEEELIGKVKQLWGRQVEKGIVWDISSR